MHKVPWTGRDVTKTQLANEPTSMNIIEGEVMNLPERGERDRERERERERGGGTKERERESEAEKK